ncbi:hypothetical protein [Duganella aceris]|uniref:DUF3168 domain-containing protein n=1 Tax=Duganella aceris TaxID=2703883 RepID=A0ABX0FP47_9BURK|nr:hypothetical protein [Duganella aceris]NGZ86412.1 hypothetical protein [Duganella aceris]
MTTAHRAIRQAMVDRLKAAPALVGGRVFANRDRSIGVDSPNAIVVRLRRSVCQLASVIGGPTNWTTLVSVECYGRAASDDSPADQVVDDVFAKLAVDPTLGGLVMECVPYEGDTLNWDSEELDEKLECITAIFEIKHQTTGRTLT